ncbi:diguanylate cyclase domain-containing protein [Paracidovorax anthurii]|uniref:Diguanylate cyclase (GGDEF)-like protein n=1 Tax=Paracidovorax anthurii TaxID=78229 RepID=A0A328ZKZ4_9BURK|nr:diguanylate cyclase [Paracidovorax anthurii]RAR86539.1 diguanylate cyclase (GGDEF)-like protein [Paracidovorax anthurii]
MKRDFLPSASTSRFLMLLVLALTAVQLVAFVFLHYANRQIALESVDAALDAGALTFEYTGTTRREYRQATSELIAKDYGLQNTIFNETNRATIESALFNQLARSGAELIVLTDLSNRVLARSSATGLLSERDADLDAELERLVAGVKGNGRNMRPLAVTDHTQLLHSWVKVTVRAPVPVAHIYLAYRLTNAGVEQFTKMTQLQMAFVSRSRHHTQSKYTIHATTLPPSILAEDIQHHEMSRDTFSVVDDDGSRYRVKVIAMDEGPGYTVNAVVAKPFAPVFSPFLKLEALFALSITFSSCISILAVKMVANRVVTPLEDVAQKDPLTGLANRRTFEARLLAAEREQKKLSTGFAVMLMDLNKFKFVNDTYGHDSGDIVLKEISQRMRKLIRSSDTLARLGGDEFAILVRTNDVDTLADIATSIGEVVKIPIQIRPDLSVEVGASIGIALSPAHSQQGTEVLHHADMAMYSAKKRGGGFEVAELPDAGTGRESSTSAGARS